MKRETLPEPYRSAIRFDTLRPAQAKAVEAGLLEGKNLLICTPTASGKTLIAILAALRAKISGAKTVYIAPLKALASEKAIDFKSYPLSSTLSIGDYDDQDSSLGTYDVIVTTPEKLDSLIRHSVPWLGAISTIIVDEVHTLGDTSRGPTLEILITILRQLLPKAQIVALSATVQNAAEIAIWLNATLVQDNWRPVELKEAISHAGELIYKN